MRGKRAKKRQVKKDLRYDSALVTGLISRVLQQGKKSAAEKAVYGALANLDDDRGKALLALDEALKNILPQEEVRSRRVGGATYQFPVPLTRERAETLALRWLVTAARKRTGMPMVEKLTRELQDAAKGQGAAVNKKLEVERIAEANRAFAHFRW